MRNLLYGRTLTVSPAISSGDGSGQLINSSAWGTRSSRILTDGVISPPDMQTVHNYAVWNQAEDSTVALTADLGVNTACSVLRIWGAHDFGTTARPKAILVESSDDASAWTTVLNLTGLTSPGTGSVTNGWLLEADLSAAGSHRYWRTTLTHKAQFLRMTEIQISEASVPLAPTSLVATAISATRIDLTWTDNATDETGYRVERSPDGVGSWVNVSGSLAAGTTSHSSTGLSAGTQYFYRVFAFNAAGDSAASNTANATTLAAPAGGDTNRMGGTGAIRRPPRPVTR